ncbi:Pvc16 family protein [Saccharopolyspora sp. NFXS83]|uniref:DUF4255 domain-containing protein n=1 Tax=Saccharopolyspora sp. NFXS83 TaxID=2993560 RepID=UPI00224B9875|nr:Pvc16 family protein [Saccharopolyspora sp. NFXS83]MCX2731953.1 Pvc16 family protein [Saccharopolyspora sp. NFXS83]
MSNGLALATVTQALALLIESNLRPEIDFAVSVETRKPPAEPPTDPTITVFLYQVAPNPSMRNTDLPSRGSSGALLARPTAALDLHYLISAYGEETELVGQRLIGCVVRTLQEIPVLSRDLLLEAASRPHLAGSDLADSPQRVRFSPIQMDTDETSKLWGMLHQTPYALSATYQGSMVLIEGREQPVPPKPVERVVPSVRPFEAPGAPATRPPEPPGSGGSAEPPETAASASKPADSQAGRPVSESPQPKRPRATRTSRNGGTSSVKRSGTAKSAAGAASAKRSEGSTKRSGSARTTRAANPTTRKSPPAEGKIAEPSTSDERSGQDGKG